MILGPQLIPPKRGEARNGVDSALLPAPLARFVNPQPGPDHAARIQDGDLITNSSFFDHVKKTWLPRE